MKYSRRGVCTCLATLAFALTADTQEISICGTVVNNHGTPLGGASVKLLGAGRMTGTDSAGAFGFQATGVAPAGAPGAPQAVVRLHGTSLRLELARAVHELGVTVHDMSGRVVNRLERRELAPGHHALVCLPGGRTPRAALLVRVSLDGAEHVLSTVASSSAGEAARQPAATMTAAVRTSAAVVDTLRVEMGGVRKDTAIESYQLTDMSIVLDYEIPTVPPLPDKTMAEQNAAKAFFEGLGADFVGFRHKDHDPAKDVIGFAISTWNSGTGVMTDDDIQRLRDFPKLRSVWIQNQDLSDAGVAVLAEFPDLIEARFHYMKTTGSVTADFVVPMNVHRNMRVFEVKHCFGMNTVNVGKLDGFPHIVRVVLDNGAATNQGALFLTKCPNLRYLQFHRATMTQQAFDQAIAALPNLEVVWCRSSNSVGADGLAAFTDHPSLKGIRLISEHETAMKTYADFLMPLATIPSFETFYGGYKLSENPAEYPESLKRLLNERPDIEATRNSGDIDYGFIFIPKSDLNRNSASTVEATLP